MLDWHTGVACDCIGPFLPCARWFSLPRGRLQTYATSQPRPSAECDSASHAENSHGARQGSVRRKAQPKMDGKTQHICQPNLAFRAAHMQTHHEQIYVSTTYFRSRLRFKPASQSLTAWILLKSTSVLSASSGICVPRERTHHRGVPGPLRRQTRYRRAAMRQRGHRQGRQRRVRVGECRQSKFRWTSAKLWSCERSMSKPTGIPRNTWRACEPLRGRREQNEVNNEREKNLRRRPARSRQCAPSFPEQRSSSAPPLRSICLERGIRNRTTSHSRLGRCTCRRRASFNSALSWSAFNAQARVSSCSARRSG